MLVLSRRKSESIEVIFGDTVAVITICEVQAGQGGNGKVRIGIEAPPTVTVLRSELRRDRDALVAASESAQAPKPQPPP